ncbi:aspartate aminotransferase family protein [Paracoccus sediminicola]|uniref:aspartate aminotransferase family protein n=1 Tax=Paracoccus sediminicola TaxID=3017783 RepID=UPI0022F11D52|nr:aspartate aminotransferase family protein [Paracoccus sediminicola]WBU56622.1 aspartate aminotransferase family protein [Paracoccus sediminicola]
MSDPVLHRIVGSTPPRAAAASGCWIVDEAGNRYLDASSGAAVSALGHAHPALIEAVTSQLMTLDYAHTGFFTSAPAQDLAARLVELSDGAFASVYFVNDGSEAVEAALKLARQAALQRGEESRRRIIARRQSYHGNTLGALGVSGHLARRQGFAPLLTEAHFTAPCYEYRHRRPDETAEDYGARLISELAAEIAEMGGDTVLAVIAETVSGATIGAATPVPGYLRGLRTLCDQHGITLILDEVMCGAGRTGHFFAFEAEGVTPDLCTMAKGLAAGVQPIGAVLVSGQMRDALARDGGAIRNGHTYSAHPVACAAALAATAEISNEDMLARVRELGDELAEALAARLGAHPHVGDLRGRGLLRGIELVADRDSKTPFSPDLRLASRIKSAAMQTGLCVYPGSGTADGVAGDHILLAPPFICTSADIAEIVDRFARALDAALKPVLHETKFEVSS